MLVQEQRPSPTRINPQEEAMEDMYAALEASWISKPRIESKCFALENTMQTYRAADLVQLMCYLDIKVLKMVVRAFYAKMDLMMTRHDKLKESIAIHRQIRGKILSYLEDEQVWNL